MKGVPSDDFASLKKHILELQALLAVSEAKHRALRRLVVEVFQMLKVQHPSGESLGMLLQRISNEEIDATLATISDDDPSHAHALKQLIASAKRQF